MDILIDRSGEVWEASCEVTEEAIQTFGQIRISIRNVALVEISLQPDLVSATAVAKASCIISDLDPARVILNVDQGAEAFDEYAAALEKIECLTQEHEKAFGPR